MRVFVAGKLVQRSQQDNDGDKRQTVEIQVTHVGPDLQFATAEVTKAAAG
jgi:single-strand DNA-binding protein